MLKKTISVTLLALALGGCTTAQVRYYGTGLIEPECGLTTLWTEKPFKLCSPFEGPETIGPNIR